MIIRIIVLSLVLMFCVGLVLSFTSRVTEAGAIKTKNFKKKYRKHKKYSKKWWREYRKRVRIKKASNARKRMLQVRRIRLDKIGKVSNHTENQNFTDVVPAIKNNGLFILVEGKIKKVLDGNTVNVETKDGKVYLVRMLGVKAPDLKKDSGYKSQKKLSDLILGKDATVIVRKKDSVGRYIGTVYSGGEDINLILIESGMALLFKQDGYEPIQADRQLYEYAEQNARILGKGLWRKQKSNNVLALKK